ncbi:hypothetical protein TNCV_634371 [Trichonephila clavipes]|nr:hypothetical protein TNCV_634371 [Trichonephila clavipes]
MNGVWGTVRGYRMQDHVPFIRNGREFKTRKTILRGSFKKARGKGGLARKEKKLDGGSWKLGLGKKSLPDDDDTTKYL